jgi:photosystem II stability/assembly factor-like uncharacterized protein
MMKKHILICFIGIVYQTFGQWIPVDIPTKSSFRALKSLGDEIWAGGTQGTFGHSSDAGKTWRFVQIPGAEQLDFRDLVILNKQEVLLMSAGPSEEGKASIWRTQDAGEHWKLVFEKKEPGFFFDCIQWDRSRQEGWLLADPIQRKLTLFQIRDREFTQIDTSSTPLLQAKEAFFAASGSSLSMNGNHLLLTGGGGAFARIYLKPNQKSAWTYTETNIPTGEAKGYFSIGLKNKKTFWAVGGDYRKLNEGTIPILITQDGGISWQELTNTPSFYMEKVIWAKPYWIVSGPSQSAAYYEKMKQWKNLGPSPYHNIIQVGGEIWGIGAKGQLGKISLSLIDKLFLAEK